MQLESDRTFAVQNVLLVKRFLVKSYLRLANFSNTRQWPGVFTFLEGKSKITKIQNSKENSKRKVTYQMVKIQSSNTSNEWYMQVFPYVENKLVSHCTSFIGAMAI